MIESQQIQPTGEQLVIVIGDECVGQAWWNYVCQYSAGVYLQCSYLQVFFIIKLYSSNLDWVGGSCNKFGKIRWALKFLSTSLDGSPNLLAKFVIYLQPTLAVTL
jgi:hypothetical protein